MAKITLQGDPDFDNKMNRWGDRIRNAAEEGTEAAVRFTLQRVPSPPSQSGKPMIFVSERQRTFVIASIREGTMQVPYRRTNRMLGGLGGEVRPLGKKFEGIIGTNAAHAPDVISSEPIGGAGPQSRYHEGTWFKLQDVVKNLRNEIVEVYRNFVERALN